MSPMDYNCDLYPDCMDMLMDSRNAIKSRSCPSVVWISGRLNLVIMLRYVCIVA